MTFLFNFFLILFSHKCVPDVQRDLTLLYGQEQACIQELDHVQVLQKGWQWHIISTKVSIAALRAYINTDLQDLSWFFVKVSNWRTCRPTLNWTSPMWRWSRIGRAQTQFCGEKGELQFFHNVPTTPLPHLLNCIKCNIKYYLNNFWLKTFLF